MQPVKLRTRSGLFGLWPDLQVRAAHGRHDKMEMIVGGTISFRDVELLGGLQRSLAIAEPPVFRAAEGRHPPRRKQQVRKGWLFSGQIRYFPAAFRAGRMPLELQLRLNPTRFAAHTARFGVPDVGSLRAITARELLTVDPQTAERLRAQTTNWTDNYIPEGPWLTAVNQAWFELLEIYFEATKNLVQSAFEANAAAVDPRSPPTLSLAPGEHNPPSLGRIEVYWETVTPSARTAMPVLIRAAQEAAPRLVRRSRDAVEQGHDDGMPWVSCRLRKGVSLTIYAKSDDRIRFEMTYAAKDGRRLGNLLLPDNRFRQHLSLRERLNLVSVDAAVRLNRVFPLLLGDRTGAGVSHSEAFADVIASIATIAAHYPANRRRAVVDAILSGGTIVARTHEPAFGAAQHLVRHKIYERVKLTDQATPVLFRPTAKYREVVHLLRWVLMPD